MRSRITWTLAIIVLLVSMAWLMRFKLTALQQPGAFETVVSNWARRFLVHRASRHVVPPPPADTKAAAASGAVQYGLSCGMCHGPDGHAKVPMGEWMYPRAADLTGKEVQSYSDQELYWILQNGIRFTGMPAFGEVKSPEDIWDLVEYVRTLPAMPPENR